jgi:hypothetical protein
MANWIKNALGLAFFLVVLGVAKQVWVDRADADVEVFRGHVRTTNNPASSHDDTGVVHTSAVGQCRRPEHGVDFWRKTQVWTADSGWRRGGSNPGDFCGGQKVVHEAQFPGRTVVLLDTPPESHKSVYNPFKHDYYRYSCVFEDRWDPTYKLALDESCADRM